MYERFTERARQVLVLAQDEARALKHNYVGSEHLLLGMLREEEGLAARVLGALDITVEDVRAKVGRFVGWGEGRDFPNPIPLTPRSKKILDLALREALSLGHNYIGTEHILLGFVRVDEGVGAQILRDEEVDPEKVRNEVNRSLSPRKPAKPAVTEALDNGVSANKQAVLTLVRLTKSRDEQVALQAARALLEAGVTS